MKNVLNRIIISFFKQIVWICIASSCVFMSCMSTKSITYFQPVNPQIDEMVTKIETVYTPFVKSGDILSISVNGLDKDDREIFNPPPITATQHTQVTGFVLLHTINGFTVDTEGYIVLPQIGKIQVGGLTTQEVEILITEPLQEYIKSPTVSVNIANYIISVLGEVARPAQYVIPHNLITIPEALALAGDLTIYGNRKNVQIIREFEGQRHFARIDLTQRSLFESPYYYLHSGDIIYVAPTAGKLTSTDRIYQVSPIIISSLSFLILILNTLLNK